MANYKDELMHFGIPGMRWGKRRASQASKLTKIVEKKSKEDKAKEKLKAEKEYIKSESKIAAKKGLTVDIKRDGVGNVTQVGQAYDSKGRKIGAETAQKILDQAEARQTLKAASLTATAVVGYGVVMAILSS